MAEPAIHEYATVGLVIASSFAANIASEYCHIFFVTPCFLVIYEQEMTHLDQLHQHRILIVVTQGTALEYTRNRLEVKIAGYLHSVKIVHLLS